MSRIAIVGAGISGLAAAHALSKRQSTAEIVLFEANSRPGGVIATMTSHGRVFELGPDSLLTRKSQAVDLCVELGLGDQLIGTRAAGSLIWHDGRLHELPKGFYMGIPTSEQALLDAPLLSAAAKQRALLDLTMPDTQAPGDQSLGRLLRSRFGDELVDVLIEPLLGGIYAGQIDQMSTQATLPELLDDDFQEPSLIRRIARHLARRPAADASTSPFQTLACGLAALPERLAQMLNGRIALRLATPVLELTQRSKAIALRTHAGWEHFDHVLLATPAPVSGRLLEPLSSRAATHLRSIPCADLATVSLLFAAGDLQVPEKTGFLVPRGEGRAITACTFVDRKWARRHDDGLLAIRVFLGRAEETGLLQNSDQALLDRVREDLKVILRLQTEPLFQVIQRLPQAMPQYAVGHRERMAEIERDLSGTNIRLIGAALDGVGIPDCIRIAQQASLQLD